MTTWNSKLWRLARRIHEAYAAAHENRPALHLPDEEWRELQMSAARLRTAETRDWSLTAARLRETLAADLERLGYRLRDRLLGLRTGAPRPLPIVPTLYAELMASEAEFESLESDGAELAVVTEPIVLEGIVLGPFAIRLDLERLDGDMPYRVVALEPNPAASSSDTTHPHVNGDRLCPGEGRAAINGALQEGRLFDFFIIVRQVLKTYAAGSAYVELNRWSGTPCHDCDVTVDEDEGGVCNRCEEALCDDCLIHCGGCGESYCSDCIDRCGRCDEYACSNCLVRCVRCRRKVCGSCREDELCETCREELEEEYAEEESNEPLDETSGTSAKPAL